MQTEPPYIKASINISKVQMTPALYISQGNMLPMSFLPHLISTP